MCYNLLGDFMNVLEINVLVLAYLGDTIYENYVRKYLINKDLKLVPKNKDLKLNKKIKYDEQTNNQIKKIIYTNSKKVKPGYKKKIKKQIYKIKQKIRHQNIEKKVKRVLTNKNIQRSKSC